MVSSFTETQKFKQAWLWTVLAIVATVTLVNFRFPQAVKGQAVDAVTALIIGIVPVLLIILFYLFRLETRIDESGVHYKFFPFHTAENKLDWDQVEKLYVRKYKPIMEYGGWGIKGLGRNRALNVSGNMGIQIELKNGNRLLLGTKKPREAEEVIMELTRLGYVNKDNSNITTKDRF